MSAHSTVSKIIAVTSCKGGVGKSTVALAVAFELAARGHRVGLFDADVHGPSLPTLLPHAVCALSGKPRVALDKGGWEVRPFVQPTHYDGSSSGVVSSVKVMSFGWLSKLWLSREGAEVRSGHPPGQLAYQLLHSTQWGDLDYLIVDSPPGTGEVRCCS
jgi:Mrp family chromosome partitioning ATPase